MRWDLQLIEHDNPGDGEPLPGMPEVPGRIRVVRSPEFAGITFHEVAARSALNRVPGASQLPFGWTINPYRGCTHGCVYCFARGTHSYLEFDTGHDFDTQIVVKVNIGEVLRREVSRRTWSREHVAMGTNTDPYQRAEGRYRLMPGIIEALAASGTPFSILTKGTVLARDIPALAAASARVPVGLGISLALLDPELQATLEPGTPSPRARMDLIRRIRDAGLPCGVFVAPVLPYLTDSPQQLADLVGQLVEAGATGVSGIALHLRPGTRDWFFGWLGAHRAELVAPYRRLYARGSYAAQDYRDLLAARLRSAQAFAGLSGAESALRGVPGDVAASFPGGSLPDRPGGGRTPRLGLPGTEQLSLM